MPFGRVVAIGLGALVVFVVTTVIAGEGANARAVPEVAPPTGTLDRGLVRYEARGIDRNRAARAELDHFRWIDRDAGIAEIPIDRAIDVVARSAR